MRASAADAADPAVTLASFKVVGFSGDVTVISYNIIIIIFIYFEHPSPGSSDAAVRPSTVKTVKLGDTVGLTASVTVRKSD